MRPFPAEALDLPDQELCVVILDWWVATHAEFVLGIPANSVPPAQAERIVADTRNLSIEDVFPAAAAVQLAPLEKALRLAASGDLRAAGIFREYMRQRSMSQAKIQEAASGGSYMKSLRARASKASADSRKAAAKQRHSVVLQRARALIDAGKNPRNVASIIAKEPEVGLSERQIRGILKGHLVHGVGSGQRKAGHVVTLTLKKRKAT